jgi:hypothetical protein
MEHRKIERRTFTHYMQVLDASTGRLIGHLADISDGGFKLDCQQAIAIGKDFRMYINLSKEIADKTTLVFGARSRWCQQDPLDPTSYIVGFQVIGMQATDQQIFHRMFEKYGVKKNNPYE